MGSQLENAPLHPDVNVRCAPASRQESGSVYTSVFPFPKTRNQLTQTLIFKLCERRREASGPVSPFPPPAHLPEPQILQNRIRNRLTLPLPVPRIPNSTDLNPVFFPKEKSLI